MIFKVLYQESKEEAPRRETTKTLFVEADSLRQVRQDLDTHTDYSVEFIQELTGDFLEYEQENNPDYKVVTF
ncbi:DNA-dependent RNA polymerase subunit epsilon [Hutsoniella sourekii]